MSQRSPNKETPTLAAAADYVLEHRRRARADWIAAEIRRLTAELRPVARAAAELRVLDDAIQTEWEERLAAAGVELPDHEAEAMSFAFSRLIGTQAVIDAFLELLAVAEGRDLAA